MAILSFVGKKNAGFAIHSTGFITGLPIFCDSGFIVLNGINRSLVQSARKPMIFMASVLAAGLYSVHCLIPPHPGPTAAAGIMGASIGMLILYGIPVALVASLCGFLWAKFMCKNEKLNHTESNGQTELPFEETELPPTFRSLLPILVPVILLTGRSIVSLMPDYAENPVMKLISFIGEPVIALIIGIILAISLYKKIDVKSLNELFDLSIEKAGTILAIIAAGGIFGTVIKATGVGEVAGNYLAATGMGLLIPFLIAAFLKIAQGSSTVAVMTAASIVAPMLKALNLDHDSGIIFATLAMGAGSMIVSHTNDAFFWVVTKFSELEPKLTLRVYTTMTLVMGISAFITILIASKLFL